MSDRDRHRAGGPSAGRHREILAVLADATGPLSVREVAKRPVKRNETVMDADEYEQRVDRTRISLHHNALPKLADRGAVDYDREARTVAPRHEVAVDWHDGDRAATPARHFAAHRSFSITYPHVS